jgi:acyl-coenzyme A synthetase/AMP-(fatty) acid ligase/acyl carrier protein
MGQLVAEGGGAGRFPALRLAFVVGDVLTRHDVRRLQELAPELVCVNHYGSTETQRAVGYYVVPPRSAETLPEVLPLGRGIPDVQLLVVNAAGAQAGIGEVGEIWVRSPHVALGYLSDRERTVERFVINPWTGESWDVVYRTGDLGRYLPDGNVAFAGRVDQQVKVRGFRIELGEVESVLGRHPAVREVAVVAAGAAAERHLVAYIVPAATAQDGEELIALLRGHLKERLPDYMVPAVWMRLAALPLTPNGKLDRHALPAPEQPATAGEHSPPRSLTEELLVDIWREVLQRERVGIRDNFFDLGGHSLLAARVVARLRAAADLELPLRALFEAPTIESLAQRVEALLLAGESEAANV